MDQDTKPKNPEELEFTVMPKAYRESTEAKPVSKFSVSGKVSQNKFLKPAAIILAALILLGYGGYLVYSKFGKEEPEEAPTTPIVVPEPLPEDLDSDNDGLFDSQEATHATNFKLADTDGDGLADGDEINIYLTDPLLSDTDGDSFDDGREVARGYSPIIKISQKASPEEVKAWTERIATVKLHEPTPTTLKLKASTAQTQSKVTYTNSAYKYTFELPTILTFREADEFRLVGIYISGTNPEGEVLEDPMNVNIAVKVSGQTLKDWIASQYQTRDYEFLQERIINGISTVRLVGVKNETCPMNKTFYPKDNTIIILTWTCNQNTPFADLYEQISQSFKFQ